VIKGLRMYKLLQGNCIDVVKSLEADSINCVITSPPYWGLRDYKVDGQFGLEPTPDLYVQHLIELFREIKRVLKDDGTVWLNLGDSYAGNCSRASNGGRAGFGTPREGVFDRGASGLKDKDLVGIPWRVAFALQADGWWLRSDIIWAKRNCMPESVKDRPTRSHEYIFLLTKSPTYYYDAEAIKEPVMTTPHAPGNKKVDEGGLSSGSNITKKQAVWGLDGLRNKRDVWWVSTKPFKDAHFATFPEDLIEPCVLAGTSEKGVCPECGKNWERVIEITEKGHANYDGSERAIAMGHTADGPTSRGAITPDMKQTIGWQPTCDCMVTAPDGSRVLVHTDPIPATVLDPFNGAGTTGVVALEHGRDYIGIELNPDYIEMSKKRIDFAIQQEGLL
jgi:DNA modification methylase